MELLLDTHMALWFLDGSSRMPQKAIETISDSRNSVFVSDVSAWEIAIKHAKRPDVFVHSSALFIERCDAQGFERLRLEREAIVEYEALDTEVADAVHRDPFDRMLIAQAKAANILLVTHDKNLRLYGEPNVMVF